MIRLVTEASLMVQEPISLPDDQIHYLLHVMRQKTGDFVLAFNGRDGEWLCEITELTKKKGVLTPHRQTRPQEEQTLIMLCPALIKKENMDFVLQKATELGVSHILPVITRRTVVSRLNMERARTQVQEAAEQSERLTIPQVDNPRTLADLLQDLPEEVTLVCLTERGATTAPIPMNQPVAFLVGPEGGFTAEELTLVAKRPNTIFCHLGDTILRAETASIAILSSYRFRVFDP